MGGKASVTHKLETRRVLKIKLNYASELLKTNKAIRISDVAYESGFNDPKYFSTLFKKTFGKTPKEYSEEF